MTCNRRKFIANMALAGAAIPFTHSFGAEVLNVQKKKFPISFFTKSLDDYELELMAECLAMSSIDGFDLTVRPSGRVLPERVEDDLPKVIEIGNKYKLSTDMMVTSICDADSPYAETVLRTASRYGVKHYRMGYFDYDIKAGVWESLQKIKSNLGELVQMNKEFGIQAGYQNHSGTRVGASMWDLWELFRNQPVPYISSQFDICHAVIEGADSWLLALHLLSRNIGSLAIKDFSWTVTNGKATWECVPLGEGIIDFDTYFKTLKELNIVAPVTLHIEYPFLSKEEESLSLLARQKIIVAKLTHDVEFICGYLKKFEMI